MEYLLNKIYSDPIYSVKNLTTFQLNYFLDYFKFECFTEYYPTSQESVEEDREMAYVIYKNIKSEIKQRVKLGIPYQQLH